MSPSSLWNRQTESILREIDRLPRRRWARFWESLFQPRAAFGVAMMVLMMFFGYRYLHHTPHGILNPTAELDSSDLAFSDEPEGSVTDLTEEQVDRYYAYTIEKYFPDSRGDVDPEEGWIDDLNEKELNRAIQYFQNRTGGQVL